MSPLSALGSRPFQAPALAPPSRQADGKSAPADTLTGSARPAPEAVSLSKNGIDLSAQGLADRVDELGNATIDVAQNFIASFAQSLFGDAAKGAAVSFDAASISAQSGFAAVARHSAGPDGIQDGAAFSLNESAHFIGKGKITTADGQSFEFEIEVQYQARAEAAATRSTSGAAPAPDGHAALPTVQLPDIDFAGALGDLFKLLGRHLQGDLPASSEAGADKAGTLSLRLLNLISHATVLDGKTAAAADPRAKALANAYGVAAPVAPEAAAPAAGAAAATADAPPAPAESAAA